MKLVSQSSVDKLIPSCSTPSGSTNENYGPEVLLAAGRQTTLCWKCVTWPIYNRKPWFGGSNQ
jgi:hypothetical protein